MARFVPSSTWPTPLRTIAEAIRAKAIGSVMRRGGRPEGCWRIAECRKSGAPKEAEKFGRNSEKLFRRLEPDVALAVAIERGLDGDVPRGRVAAMASKARR